MSSPLEILLEYLDRAVSEADRRASQRAQANDWTEFAYQKRRAADFQRQRQRLLQVLGGADNSLDPQKVLDTLVNSV